LTTSKNVSHPFCQAPHLSIWIHGKPNDYGMLDLQSFFANY
jgi:hypothetical protein